MLWVQGFKFQMKRQVDRMWKIQKYQKGGRPNKGNWLKGDVVGSRIQIPDEETTNEEGLELPSE